MTTIYTLDRLDSSILINGEKVKLTEGMYVIPAFRDRKVAEEYTQNGKFPISEVTISEVTTPVE